MKNLVKRREKTKVNRQTNHKKEEIEKAFSYNLNIIINYTKFKKCFLYNLYLFNISKKI